MKNSEIIKNNKLIDIFMGSKGEYISHKNMYGGEIWGSYKSNNYHSSWDCLIPVVNKIAKIWEEYNCNPSSPKGWADAAFELYDSPILFINKDKLYSNVIKFIKWHNEKS